MAFEEAMAQLGDELGLPLEIESGTVAFEASFGGDGEEPVGVEISAEGGGDHAVVSADVGRLPAGDTEAFALQMLEANHLFAGTAGAALSVGGERILLERRTSLDEFARGGGANLVYSLVGTARSLRDALVRRDSGDDSLLAP